MDTAAPVKIPHDKEKRLSTDIIAQLAEHTIFGLAGTIVNSGVVVLILHKSVAMKGLLWWFFILLLISICRINLQILFKKNISNEKLLKNWKIYFLLSILISGIIWGFSGVAFFSEESVPHQAFLAFVLGGMVAGSVGVYSVMIRAFLFFSIPALFPLIIRLAFMRDSVHLSMSFMLFLFWLIMLFTARKLHENLIKSLELKYENKDLINDLENEIEARKAAEAKLSNQKDEVERIVEKRTQQLKDARLRQNEAVNAGNVGLWDWHLTSNRVQYSKEWKKQMGYEDHEIGDDLDEWQSRVHPEDIGPALEQVERVLKYEDHEYRAEFRFRHKDGSYRWILAQGSVLKDESGKPARMLGSHIDITERKRMEDELQKTHKLESLGVLAGGIAHDFNNILSTILGNISMARELTDTEDEISGLLIDAEEASKNARKLTRQLLTFAKGGVPLKEVTSMNRIIKETISVMTRGSEYNCEFSIDENLWPVEIDAGQITQAINNIAVNSRQAMPDGGMISVSAGNLMVSENHLPLNSGKYIRISIRDQGSGIPEKYLSRIFDPYFTTKQNASGLGLATAYSIINKHGGLLTAESQHGMGAAFHIYLPASDKEISIKEETRIVMGHGNVLVMDDEADLLKIYGKILERLGYKPEYTSDGAEAVLMYKAAMEQGNPYDIVILDLTIPGGMGGEETIKKLLEIDPDVKAIVSSGYSDDEVMANFREYGFKGMMQKPFDIKTLSIVMKDVSNMKTG